MQIFFSVMIIWNWSTMIHRLLGHSGFLLLLGDSNFIDGGLAFFGVAFLTVAAGFLTAAFLALGAAAGLGLQWQKKSVENNGDRCGSVMLDVHISLKNTPGPVGPLPQPSLSPRRPPLDLLLHFHPKTMATGMDEQLVLRLGRRRG